MAYYPSDIEDAIALWQYDEQQADPRSIEADISSGLRATNLVGCQYWIKGLSAICSHWNGDQCTYAESNENKPLPSGYNNGKCDYLGRRRKCDKYDKTGQEDDLSKYHCVAPNIFLSGVGTVSGTATTGYTFTRISKENIKGYCGGRCDEQGRGTGCNGTPGISPIVCNYFRPWQMGFGSIKPHQIERSTTADGKIYITHQAMLDAYGQAFEKKEKRLPFSFKVYNLRAQYQKCAYWDGDSGAFFKMTSTGDIESDEDLETLCSCPNAAATTYHTLATPEGAYEWLLQGIWSDAHTVICNGAKPECPCYTGEWVYCDDVNMVEGMRITANQIFELRFWTNQWGSQEEYDKYYKKRPNPQDVSTPAIFIFKKWLRLNPLSPSDSVAEGQKLEMCQPAPLNERRFVPSNFINATTIQYTKTGIDIGTTSPEKDQVYFPSLVRDPEEDFGDFELIDVMYPYATMNPFDTDVCGAQKETLSLKRGISMDGDSISAIGYTVSNQAVYAFNLNMFDNFPSEFNEHIFVSTISDKPSASGEGVYGGLSKKEEFFLKLKAFIETAKKTNPLDIAEGTSDSYGYFKLDPIRLKYQERNKIAVCVYFSDKQKWDFRIRPVLSKWYGGILVQNSFNQQSFSSLVPQRFSPAAKITGKAITFIDNAGGVPTKAKVSCSLGNIIHTASNEYISATDFDTHWTYTYCYKKITKKNVVINNWARIGNGGKIWVELEDININHIFEWGITSAKMVSENDISGCDGNVSGEIEMKNIEIESFVSGKRSVPPSAYILEPTNNKRIIFFNDEWTLQITYWYKEISNDIETESSEETEIEISSPDFDDSNIRFDESYLDLSIDESSFTVGNVTDQTVALMGQFIDEDSRIVACMNTKMLTQAVKVYCRNVEILYRYEASASSYTLKPETSTASFAVPPFSEVMTGEHSPHISWPFCGDHKNGFMGRGKGYMWFPYTTCDDKAFYREYSSAASCTAYFKKGGAELRLQGPIKYHAWVSGAGGGAYSPCVLDFHYHYSRASDTTVFTGKANLVAYIDWNVYTAWGWMLPTFGNKGREMVTKFLSQDHWSHLSFKETSNMKTYSQWVPVVPDLVDSFMSFNSFDEVSTISPDDFSHINQLNFLTSGLIGEEISSERKDFDEVFGTRGIWRATYPPPLVTEGTIQKIQHFYFKDPQVAWAWQERWKDVEYVDRKFFFITYDKPEYNHSYEKEEHRYICDEGTYTISYTAPEISGDEIIKHPSLQLGDGPKRFFKLNYESSSDDVQWMDEGTGSVDGSVDEGAEPNIYEVTSPTPASSKWNHDENCLFDSEAVRTYVLAETAGKEFKFINTDDEVESNYYNRGIIVNLTRERLDFLPYEEIDMQFVPDIVDEAQAEDTSPVAVTYGVWYNASPTFTYSLGFSNASCIYKVILKGKWGITYSVSIDDGTTKNYRGCSPGVEITGVSDAGSDLLWTKSTVFFDEDIYGDMGIKDFEFEFLTQPTLDRMVNAKENELKVKLNCAYNQYLFIDSIQLKAASYCNSTEEIVVYERKYLTSIGSNFGDHNINGPKVGDSFVLQYELEMDNSGTYYAISPAVTVDYVPRGTISARDKMRSVYAQEQHYADESITVDINNLVQIEQEKQKSTYTTAYSLDTDGESTSYSIVCPPALENFLSEYSIPNTINGTCSFSTTKTPWSYYDSLYTPSEIWYPGGHKWQWGPDITRMKCWEYAYGSTAFVLQEYDIGQVLYMHMDLGGGVEPLDPLSALYAERMQYQIDVATKLGTEVEDTSRIMGTARTFVDTPTVPGI